MEGLKQLETDYIRLIMKLNNMSFTHGVEKSGPVDDDDDPCWASRGVDAIYLYVLITR